MFNYFRDVCVYVSVYLNHVALFTFSASFGNLLRRSVDVSIVEPETVEEEDTAPPVEVRKESFDKYYETMEEIGRYVLIVLLFWPYVILYVRYKITTSVYWSSKIHSNLCATK